MTVDVRRITCAPDREDIAIGKRIKSVLPIFPAPRGGGEGLGVLPKMANHREAPFEKGTFFKPQVYERVDISLIEECERVGKSVI